MAAVTWIMALSTSKATGPDKYEHWLSACMDGPMSHSLPNPQGEQTRRRPGNTALYG